jgi:NADH-quinone oxidoreductase subunit G
MPTVTINNKQYEFTPGETVIEVAERNGINIPHYCWHPRLSVSGNCRMCLVEIEKIPKLAIACSTTCMDGMVVHVDSEKAVAGREHVMEFLLINHPLDCPICDEAGECKLQDYAYQHGTGESRFIEEKNHKPKRVKLGPYVMFDAERCISCSRCIRFSKEIAKEDQLTFVQRGDRVTIETFPGKDFDNPYSLNVVDICPVGALTNIDFRFKARVWDLSHTPSICPGCSRGCNIDIWVRNNEILRLTPRFNENVNDYWMCDNGRVNSFKHVNAESRIDGPQIRKGGEMISVGWDEAYSTTISELKRFKQSEIAVLGSAYATVEDNYTLVKFAKNILHTKNIDFAEHINHGDEDDILIREDKTPNSLGAKLAGIAPLKEGMDFAQIVDGIKNKSIRCLISMEEDFVALSPENVTLTENLDLFIVFASNLNESTKYAHIVFPAAAFAEKNGVFVNFEGHAQRIRPAVMTAEMDRSLDGMNLSRLDKFGTEFDRWGKSKKINSISSWKIITKLANAFGVKFNFETSEDVFTELCKVNKEFKDLDYDKLGSNGAKLNSYKKIQEITTV